ncbi:MAG: hypothetical protein IKM73_00420 [Acidaminococcaceae bacterium]|jgi:hypothetical protein|nr:hypothetical protein [Acidaminococcaceae bacterium]
MYVNPFWFGVLTTILVEIVVVIIGAIVSIVRYRGDEEGGQDGSDHGKTP